MFWSVSAVAIFDNHIFRRLSGLKDIVALLITGGRRISPSGTRGKETTARMPSLRRRWAYVEEMAGRV